MLKKGAKIDWIVEAIDVFISIKREFGEAPMLKSLDFSKPFQFFSFASYHIVGTMMLQKNDEGYEQPVSFLSKSLQNADFKYDIVEKQAYALMKYFKAFRSYVVREKVIVYVPNVAVKDVFIESETTRCRCRWINRIQEFNVEF
jgi:hypothetical protein